jgi:hypothetical protein
MVMATTRKRRRKVGQGTFSAGVGKGEERNIEAAPPAPYVLGVREPDWLREAACDPVEDFVRACEPVLDGVAADDPVLV